MRHRVRVWFRLHHGIRLVHFCGGFFRGLAALDGRGGRGGLLFPSLFRGRLAFRLFGTRSTQLFVRAGRLEEARFLRRHRVRLSRRPGLESRERDDCREESAHRQTGLSGRYRPPLDAGVENRAHPAVPVRAAGHRHRRESPLMREPERPDDREQVRRVCRGSRSRREHQIVTGPLAVLPHLDADPPRERVEPVQGRSRLSDEEGEPVRPLDVRELVEEDDATSLFVPPTRSLREENDGAQEARRDGNRELSAQEETDRPPEAELCGELGENGRPGGVGVARSAPADPAHAPCAQGETDERQRGSRRPEAEKREHPRHRGERLDRRRGARDLGVPRDCRDRRAVGGVEIRVGCRDRAIDLAARLRVLFERRRALVAGERAGRERLHLGNRARQERQLPVRRDGRRRRKEERPRQTERRGELTGGRGGAPEDEQRDGRDPEENGRFEGDVQGETSESGDVLFHLTALLPGLVDQTGKTIQLGVGDLGAGDVEERRDGFLGRSVEERFQHVLQGRAAGPDPRNDRDVDVAFPFERVAQMSFVLEYAEHRPDGGVAGRVGEPLQDLGDRDPAEEIDDVHDLPFPATQVEQAFLRHPGTPPVLRSARPAAPGLLKKQHMLRN